MFKQRDFTHTNIRNYIIMKDVSLKFEYLEIDVEHGWLCLYEDDNHILVRPEQFKELLKAINYKKQ